MQITQSSIKDVSKILELYDIATAYQKQKGSVSWPKFSADFVLAEVKEQRQWKLIIDSEIACVWVHTFQDPQIWEERNEDPAIYIHRIATDPDFRGRNLVREIVKWAKEFANENNKAYIRMDTAGENRGLIEYCGSCGFEFLGLVTLKNTNDLPDHYKNNAISLFQISLNKD